MAALWKRLIRLMKRGFARERKAPAHLSGKELASLAQRMAESNDPTEVARLKTSITNGFYGN